MSEELEWEFVPGMDSSGHDIGQLGRGMSIEEMKALAAARPDCVGFNSNGWFKHTLRPRTEWSRWTDDPNKGLYVRKKQAEHRNVTTLAVGEEETPVTTIKLPKDWLFVSSPNCEFKIVMQMPIN